MTMNNKISLWNFHKNCIEKEYKNKDDSNPFHLNKKYCLIPDFIKRKNCIINPSENGNIIIWDINTQKMLKCIKAHNNVVLSTSVRHDNKIIASSSLDKTIKIWTCF